MIIYICCSKYFYEKIPQIKEKLEQMGHSIILPNCFGDAFEEERVKSEDPQNHATWKGRMIREQNEKISKCDAILVLNFDKNGQKNYIGGATFLEMYQTWMSGKKIFLYHDIPDNILKDEIIGFSPVVINEKLEKINEKI